MKRRNIDLSPYTPFDKNQKGQFYVDYNEEFDLLYRILKLCVSSKIDYISRYNRLIEDIVYVETEIEMIVTMNYMRQSSKTLFKKFMYIHNYYQNIYKPLFPSV